MVKSVNYCLRSLFVLCIILGTESHVVAQQPDSTRTGPDRSNNREQIRKPYVILISGDGFRYDYAEKYQAKNLLTLSAEGIRAKSMLPSYLSVTHPNHYAISSGLYPAHAGMMGNKYYDPIRRKPYSAKDGSFFGGEPISVTAERQGMLTADFQWVNSEAVIGGLKSTYLFRWLEGNQVTTEDRLSTLKRWISLPEDKRPHLIRMYFYDSDHAGHKFGPDSPETATAVKLIDEAIGRMAELLKESGLPVNVIFVSDHGMIEIDRERPLKIPAYVDTAHFRINNQNSLVNLYAKDTSVIAETYQKLKAEANGNYFVWLHDEVPAELRYGGTDDIFHRAGDILLAPVCPKTFNPKPDVGAHGYNPFKVKEMGATFMGWGPAFKKDLAVEPFANVEVYEVICRILGLKPAKNDGTGKLAKKILKN